MSYQSSSKKKYVKANIYWDFPKGHMKYLGNINQRRFRRRVTQVPTRFLVDENYEHKLTESQRGIPDWWF